MTTHRAEAIIAAPVARVWAVLVDLPRYPDWNPFTVRVRSSLRVGGVVDMDVSLYGRVRRQRETLHAIEPERLLSWGMQMGPRWLLRAERRQILEPLADGRTRYETVDVIEGWLAPLVRVLYARALDEGFAAMAQALKERAES